MERKKYQARFTELMNEKMLWDPVWKEIADTIYPSRGFFPGELPNQGKRIDYKKQLNNRPTIAARTLGAGMLSGHTSPSRPWFKYTTGDQDLSEFRPVREWIDTAEIRIRLMLSKSNIYRVFNSIYEEMGAFAIGCGVFDNDYYDVVRGYAMTVGEYALGLGPDGRLETFARYIWRTVEQLVTKYGMTNVSRQVQSMWDRGNKGQWIRCCHLIERNYDAVPDKQDNQNMPYLSLYWEDTSETDTFLHVSGYKRFPVVAPAWGKTLAFDCYGRTAPGWLALGDSKVLQVYEKDKAMAMDKLVNPPVQRSTNTPPHLVNALPGGVSVYNGTIDNRLTPLYQIDPRIQDLEYAIQKKVEDIDEAFYKNLFLMLQMSDDTNRTAREIIERHEEKLLALGPVLESVESEMLTPFLERVFDMAMENGILPPPPKELEEQELNIQYVSILAQAQRMVGTAAVEQLFGFAGNLAAVFPEVVDCFDSDTAVREYSSMVGSPAKIMRDPEMVAEIRQQRQQAMAQQQAAEAAQVTAQNAQVLSNTRLDNNSALDALLNNGAPKGGGAV